MMKYWLLAALMVATTTANDCCLCDNCAEVHTDKLDMFTISPFREEQEEVATCEEIAFELLNTEEDSEMCSAVRMELQEACCTDIVRKFRFVCLLQNELESNDSLLLCVAVVRLVLTPFLLLFSLFIYSRRNRFGRGRICGLVGPRCA